MIVGQLNDRTDNGFVYSAAAWRSTDLRHWERGSGVSRSDLIHPDGGYRSMNAVTAGPYGYVAVGTVEDTSAPETQRDRPAVWTSRDGRTWTLRVLRLPGGSVRASLDTVVSSGKTIVATGSASQAGAADRTAVYAVVSVDGGSTWQPVKLPGTRDKTAVTAVTATSAGFVLVGATGQVGRRDVVLWSSTDGRAWEVARPTGVGLSGAGHQVINAVTPAGRGLLAVGATADRLVEHVTLWRTPRVPQ